MKHFEKIHRFTRFLLAATVATVTLAVTLHAIATVKTPNAATYSYSLAPGVSSAPITPIGSQPVWVTGVQNTLGYRGVGRVALLHVPSSFLEWTGIESPSGAAVASGYSGTAGTHIVYLDFGHYVDVPGSRNRFVRCQEFAQQPLYGNRRSDVGLVREISPVVREERKSNSSQAAVLGSFSSGCAAKIGVTSHL